jgi:tyrosinase
MFTNSSCFLIRSFLSFRAFAYLAAATHSFVPFSLFVLVLFKAMKFAQAAFAVLGATAASAASIPIQQQHKEASTAGLHFYNGTCTPEKISVRKEWRNLSAAQKSVYLEAELCLMALPAQTTLSGVTSRFSDLQALHRSKTNVTLNGVFVQDVIHNVVS